MKTKRFILLLSALMCFAFTANLSAKKLNVVATLPSLASIAENVGGNLIQISSITKGSQDAHYLEAKPSYMLKLNKADLLIYSGLELEIGWLPLLIQGSRNNQIIVGGKGNLNASIALQSNSILEKPKGEVDRSMGDVHPSGNPHYLLDPRNALLVADLMNQKFSALDPANQNAYQQNYETFKHKLEQKITEYEQKFAPVKGREVVCYHPHWSYLLNWMNLIPVTYIEPRPGIPPTPKHKKETIELMQAKKIKVVIISSWKEPSKALEVAHATNAELLILPGEVQADNDSNDYFSWIESMVNKIVTAYLTK